MPINSVISQALPIPSKITAKSITATTVECKSLGVNNAPPATAGSIHGGSILVGGGIFGTLYSGGYVQVSGKSHIISGTGAPALTGAKGDLYIRRTATTTANERLYICHTTGTGATKWVGIA